MRPDAILPSEDEQAKKCASLRDQIATNEARARSLGEEIDNFENLAGRHKSIQAQDAYEAKAQQRRIELNELRIQISAQKNELKNAEHSRHTVVRWSADLDLLKVAIWGQSAKATENRSALREHLRELIEKIEVYAAGFKEQPKAGSAVPSGRMSLPKPGTSAVERNQWRKNNQESMPTTTEAIEDWLDAVLDDMRPGLSRPIRHQFAKYVIQQEMSKKGRFFRVHFKTGVILDLVPQGSIAMGMALIRNESETRKKQKFIEHRWRFVSPPLDILWKQFRLK